MRVVSVNVGLPQITVWRGEPVSTGIFKSPVEGRVRVAGVNLDGDGQADLTVHGGADKAVYVYPAEHYPYWNARLELEQELPVGMFGENLTVAGAPLEADVAIGDRLRIGSTEFIVTQPRLPCYKLGIRFGDPLMVRRFLESGRSGYYLRIAKEGYVEAGDEIELLSRDPAHVAVSEITRLIAHDRRDTEALRRVLAVDALPDDLRPFFEGLAARGVGTS
jgi:MOSC domain-containing protein YiiM